MPFSRDIGFLMFRILIPTLLLVIQFVLYARARNWLQAKYPARQNLRRALAGVFILMNVVLLYVAIARPRASEIDPLVLHVIAYPFFLWHGATLFIGVLVLLSMLVKAPFQILFALLKRIKPAQKKIVALQAQPAYQSFDASRRTFLRRGMYGLTAASFGASAYGMFIEKSQHEVTNVLCPIRNLPQQLHGFTIAFISDIHSSINMMKDEMIKYVNIVNSLQCDMILVTGDFVNSQTDEVYPFAEAFSSLSAPHGVYGVMGNHDFFAPQPETVAKEVDACGVKLLRNDNVLISKNGGSFYLIGIDDVGRTERAAEKLEIAARNTLMKIPKLAMIHRPYFLQQAADANIDLVLSGHTHGGQVVFARFGNATIAPASLASRYVWGNYKIGNTQMYVNRGIGTVGLPIRLNCPPEITKVTLMPKVGHV
jgi:predicted MPP superfamily phosphohydrolase